MDYGISMVKTYLLRGKRMSAIEVVGAMVNFKMENLFPLEATKLYQTRLDVQDVFPDPTALWSPAF
jgi:hypothetical protein